MNREAIGNNIKAELKKCGKTQKELAEEINVTEVTMSRWISGKRQPTVYGLYRIAKVLCVNMESLMEGVEEMADRSFIMQEKRFRRKMIETIPQIYAAFALSLHRRYGFGYLRILRVLSDTQKYWQAAALGEFDILQTCSDETGIDMLSAVTAKETGAEGEEI